MSDNTIRTLERSGRAIGGVDDRLAWLAARQRSGDLEPAGLELAAFAGDPAARVLLPDLPLWDPTREEYLLASWGGFPALAGSLALLRQALERSDEPAPEGTHELIDACAELLHAPSEEWLELIASFPPPRVEHEEGRPPSDVGRALFNVRHVVNELPRNPAGAAGALSVALQRALERPGTDATAREAIVRRALASPQDPAGAWLAEARWIQERVDDFWLTRKELLLLHACGHRPASIALGEAPPPEGELGAWLEQLVGRSLDLRALGQALTRGVRQHAVEDDSPRCAWCEATEARERGRPPEEVVAIRNRELVLAVEAGALPRQQLDLVWKLELASEGVPVEPTLEELIGAARSMGEWLGRRRIAAAVISRAFAGPGDKNFGRHARRRRRRARAASR